jgi:hypothetical protein
MVGDQHMKNPIGMKMEIFTARIILSSIDELQFELSFRFLTIDFNAAASKDFFILAILARILIFK